MVKDKTWKILTSDEKLDVLRLDVNMNWSLGFLTFFLCGLMLAIAIKDFYSVIVGGILSAFTLGLYIKDLRKQNKIVLLRKAFLNEGE